MSTALLGKQKRYLRAEAHALKPVVQAGKQGVSTSLLEQIDAALASHELIKVQFVAEKDDKKALAEAAQAELGAAVAGQVGHVLILYRQHKDPKKRRYPLPQ